MRSIVALSCAALGMTFLVSPWALAQGPGSDLQKLQGTWVCVATSKEGNVVKAYVGVKAVIKGNELIWYFPQKDGSIREQKNQFRIDPTKNPKHFDWWRSDKTEANADLRLYAFTDNNTMRWATNLDYKTRPTSFDEAKWVFTTKRVQDGK